MPTVSASFTTAGAPYNIFDVISGAQTTGVTLQTGSKRLIAPPRNFSRLDITVDPNSPGGIYLTDDPTASATNSVGKPILAGDSTLIAGNETNRQVSLKTKYFAPTDNGTIVHFSME